MTTLAAKEVPKLDPYKFMAVIGKRVIHPGGRASTNALLARAHITADSRALDVGCGVPPPLSRSPVATKPRSLRSTSPH